MERPVFTSGKASSPIKVWLSPIGCPVLSNPSNSLTN